MNKRTVNRLYAAIRIRDAALDKVEIDGDIGFNEFSLIKVWGNDKFYITFNTPFQKLPTVEDISDEGLAFFNLNNSLNIWNTKTNCSISSGMMKITSIFYNSNAANGNRRCFSTCCNF